MSSLHTPKQDQPLIKRQWLANLTLGLEWRGNKTALVTNTHFGPLRVQRPFYPEAKSSGCCHIYLLHPPGGLVLGDRLHINAAIAEDASALITTPSAGKIYKAGDRTEQQQQIIELQVADNGCVEWLPQETIVFNGANGRLTTRVTLSGNAKACSWDIVCLGRPASNEQFTLGRCDQTLEVWQNQKLLLLERNRFEGRNVLLDAPWGLRGGNTSGTLWATVKPTTSFVDELLDQLNVLTVNHSKTKNHQWGITQKEDLFIARYIGDSAQLCRRGFEQVWQAIRPQLNGKEAVVPRIWKT